MATRPASISGPKTAATGGWRGRASALVSARIDFEVGWATQTAAEFDQLRADRDTGYEWLATYDEDWRQALNVQATLWAVP